MMSAHCFNPGRALAIGLAISATLAQAADDFTLTEEQLRPYDGSDETKPILLAIDGIIYDVSASPSFYGPGGHYNHFTGRDATRAWVTECWDTPDQLTWRMDDVEEMFMPRYLDELLIAYTDGTENLDEMVGVMGAEAVMNLAQRALAKFGQVSKSEVKKRRKEDIKEAKVKVEEALAHWKKFFSENAKYKAVGKVVRDEKTPPPPKPCEAAMKKRAVKAGLLESKDGSNIMMGGGGTGNAKGDENLPDFKKKINEQRKKENKEFDEKRKVQEKIDREEKKKVKEAKKAKEKKEKEEQAKKDEL